jgi:hypothetical protein
LWGLFNWLLAARMPMAMARSNEEPVFFISAGARLMTSFVRGIWNPFVFMALSTRCRLSFTALSGKPTM